MSVADWLTNRAMRYPRSAVSRLRILCLRLLGAQVGRDCWIRKISIPRNPWDILIDDSVALDDGVILLSTGERRTAPRIRIGRRVYINRWTMIDATDSIEIGEDTMIGPHCYITDHDHGHLPGRLISEQPMLSKAVRIGSNVWIGAGVIILKGVEIGEGAVIGAGAVVTKPVPSGMTVAGTPARALHSSP